MVLSEEEAQKDFDKTSFPAQFKIFKDSVVIAYQNPYRAIRKEREGLKELV